MEIINIYCCNINIYGHCSSCHSDSDEGYSDLCVDMVNIYGIDIYIESCCTINVEILNKFDIWQMLMIKRQCLIDNDYNYNSFYYVS
jgi:hypothetical protein